MKIELEQFTQSRFEHFKGGEGCLIAAMFNDDLNRLILGTLTPGSSIGMHTHDTSSEIILVKAGTPKFILDGTEERLAPGQVHYCPKGGTHTMINDTEENVEFFAVVPQQ